MEWDRLVCDLAHVLLRWHGLRGAVGVEGDSRSVESGTLTKFEEVFFLGRQPGIDMGDEVMAGGRIGRPLLSKESLAPFFPFHGFWRE